MKNLRHDPKVFKFYTGFTEEQFSCLLEFLGDGMNNLTYWGSSSASNSNNEDLGGSKPGPSRKLTAEDELLLVFTRQRVGMLEQDLAVRFELSQSHVSRIITTWVNAMFHHFKEVEIWPMREQPFANLPEKVREFCPTLRCIIDATEIYIEQPKNPEAQQLTFSAYKNHNTLKSLIGISGDGAINFVSTLEGRSIADRDLTVKSGILGKDWAKGDVLMADRGFEIQDDLAPLGVKLNIPPFLKGKGQFQEDELVETRRIAKFRIHVERSIERIKNYHIFDYVPITLCSSGIIDQMFFVSAHADKLSATISVRRQGNQRHDLLTTVVVIYVHFVLASTIQVGSVSQTDWLFNLQENKRANNYHYILGLVIHNSGIY